MKGINTMITITINSKNRTLEMTKKFAAAASRFGSEEYKMLQAARKDYPTYREITVTRRRKPTINFKGLTYEYMESYIKAHDEDGKIMAEYLDLRGKSDKAKEANVESASYQKIKEWFLKTYPAVADFRKKRDKLLAA